MNIGTVSFSGNLILAPMAGITDLAFRLLAREFGCGLVTSEMVSAAGLIHGGRRTLELLASDPLERPLAVQLFGKDAETIAHAAALCEERGADLIDINMGCPVRKVVRTGAGLALMRDPALAGRIVRAVRRRVRIPLTVKMRAGWDRRSPAAVQIARAAEIEGADAVTVHPRYGDTGYAEPADRDVIRQVRERVAIPVIGNGDVASGEDARSMLAATGCHGVMIGRAALGRPWIFRQIAEYLDDGRRSFEPSMEERRRIVARHFERLCALKGSRLAAIVFRKHLAWYVRGLPGAAEFRRSVVRTVDPETMMSQVGRFFGGEGASRASQEAGT